MKEVRLKLNLDEGFRSRITAGKHTLIADEPEGVGGTDEGMSPYELLLAALGVCTGRVFLS
jgi:putative redox protein